MHQVEYSHNGLLLSHQSGYVADQDVIPDKRLYPAACDEEACRLLLRAGASLPFTTFDDRDTKEGPFVGSLVTDLAPSLSISAAELYALAEEVAVDNPLKPTWVALHPSLLAALSKDARQKLGAAAAQATRYDYLSLAQARLALLLHSAAHWADVVHAEQGEFGLSGWGLPPGLCIAAEQAQELVDAIEELAKTISSADLGLYHAKQDHQIRCAADFVFSRLGLSPAAPLEVLSVIASGRVVLVETGGLSANQLLKNCPNVVDAVTADQVPALLGYSEAGDLQVTVFRRGPSLMLAFSVFGAPLDISAELLPSTKFLSVLQDKASGVRTT